MPGGLIRFSTLSSQPIAVGDLKITVRSRALQVRFPGASGGLIWNRPIAVSVYKPDGRIEHLPVRDVTRLVQVLLVAGLVCSLFLLNARRKRSSSRTADRRFTR
jgi:hypothetical protein